MTALKHALSARDHATLPVALGLAATTEDAALRSLLIDHAFEALDRGYKPKYKDLTALLESEALTGQDQVLGLPAGGELRRR